MTEIFSLERVRFLAGTLREKTFCAAAEFVLTLKGSSPLLIETGCYRGQGCDGNSTLILAILARETGGTFVSHDICERHIDAARQLLRDHEINATLSRGDSAETLRRICSAVSFAYLDSYDFEDASPINSQAHQMVEAGILLPKMAPRSAFLLDDCALRDGGKAGLSLGPIMQCGYKIVSEGYQKLLIRE